MGYYVKWPIFDRIAAISLPDIRNRGALRATMIVSHPIFLSSYTTVVLQEALHTHQGLFKSIFGSTVSAAHIPFTGIAK